MEGAACGMSHVAVITLPKKATKRNTRTVIITLYGKTTNMSILL